MYTYPKHQRDTPPVLLILLVFAQLYGTLLLGLNLNPLRQNLSAYIAHLAKTDLGVSSKGW